MPGLRRAELHLRVAEALERARRRAVRPRARPPLRRGGAGRRAAARCRVLAPGGPRGARDARLRRGRDALRRRARSSASTIPRRRAETQLELGTARFRAGRIDDAMQAFRAAAQIARDGRRRASMLATAAVGFEEACWRPGITDEGAVELLEEASLRARRGRLRAARDAARRARPGACLRRPPRGRAPPRASARPRWRAGSTTGSASRRC